MQYNRPISLAYHCCHLGAISMSGLLGMDGGANEEDDESMIIYRGLAKGADASTVRQEVIYGEKETEIVRQKNGRIQQDLINVDIVSENVSNLYCHNSLSSTMQMIVKHRETGEGGEVEILITNSLVYETTCKIRRYFQHWATLRL